MFTSLKSALWQKVGFPASCGLLALMQSCTPALQGEYDDPEARSELLDDRWNEDDAKLTAAKMISQMLYDNWQAVENNPSVPKVERAWLVEYKKSNGGKRPVMIFKDLENRTDEHIETKAINEAIRHELINSQKVRFIDVSQRKDIGDELSFQNKSGMVAADTAKKIGRQVGADFFLTGGIASQVHQQGGKKRVSYQTNMILTSVESSEIIWSGKADIKKNFKRSSMGW